MYLMLLTVEEKYMGKIGIIHLSDIHYDDSEESKCLLNNLINDINRQINEGREFDFIVISGDIIDKGKTYLYNSFDFYLKKIIRASRLRKERVILVVGNHDLNYDSLAIKGILAEKNISKKIEEDINIIYSPYCEFISNYTSNRNTYGVKKFYVNKLKEHVIFIRINSAWSALLKKNYGELKIGDLQLMKIKKEIKKIKKKLKNSLVIAVFHHPLDWFDYDDKVKLHNFLVKDCSVDLILNGHIHQAGLETSGNIDFNYRNFYTGISYNKSGENSSRKDGMRYSIYEIDKSLETINAFLRSTNENSEFVPDNRLYTNISNDGFFVMPLGNMFDSTIELPSIGESNYNSIFLSKQFVNLLLEKEKRLFVFYQGIEQEMLKNKIALKSELQKKKEEFKKDLGINKISKKHAIEIEKKFYRDEFEYFICYAFSVLSAIFFNSHNEVRFLIRKYDKKSNTHVPFYCEGIYAAPEDLKKIKAFKWGEGLIYVSFNQKKAILFSCNEKFASAGNSKNIWKDYLTIAIDTITVQVDQKSIPLFSFNIATSVVDNIQCLRALSLVNSYTIFNQVIKLYNDYIYDLKKIYNEE